MACMAFRYVEVNPDYDMKKYELFPNEKYPTTHQWEWVAPSNGQYVVTITSNCDVPGTTGHRIPYRAKF